VTENENWVPVARIKKYQQAYIWSLVLQSVNIPHVLEKEQDCWLITVAEQLKAAAVVAVERVPREETFRYGIVSIEGTEPPEGEPVAMTDIVEKPRVGAAPSTLAVAARYVFGPEIFDALQRTVPDPRGEIQLSDAIKMLIQMGKPVYAWPLPQNQRRYDVGNFESYVRTFIEFALADERYGYLIRKYIKTKAYEL